MGVLPMRLLKSGMIVLGLLSACSKTEFKGSAASKKLAAADQESVAEVPPEESVAPPVANVDTPVNPDAVVAPPSAPVEPEVYSSSNDDIFTGCAVGTSNLPIVADVYELAVGTSALPDFTTIGPKSDTVCLSNYNIENQSWDIGFPGANQLVEWFALNSRAQLVVPTDGNYQFRISSDDGSILYIDTAKIIDNNGNHAFLTKEGAVQLTAGNHALTVDWYQGPRFNLGLQLFWKLPGTEEFVLVPTTAFLPE